MDDKMEQIGMKTNHRKAIQRNFTNLIDNCNINLLFPKLLEKNVFTESMVSKYSGPDERNNMCKLFQEYDTRGPNAFSALVESLEEIGQGNLAEDLLNSCREIPQRKHAVPYQLPTNLQTSVHNTNFIQKLSEQSPNDCINLCSESLEVIVRHTRKFSEDFLDKKHPTYKMQSKNRGQVLIINNIYFEIEKFRTGAEFDGKNLINLFQQIGMNVSYYCNKTAKEIEDLIREFTRNPALEYTDMAVFIGLSHGNQTEQNESYLKGTDSGQVKTSWIESQFNNRNCPFLYKKPKLLIYQMCRGNNLDCETQLNAATQHVTADFTPRIYNGVTYSDMLIAHSTLPGFESHRDIFTGSWYIQLICQVFMDHAHDTDVENLLKKVSHSLENQRSITLSAQSSTFQNVGFKTCYLNPGIYKEDGKTKFVMPSVET